MIHYKLLNWQGTFPRNTGKGVVVVSGQNLIQFEIGNTKTTYIERDVEGKLFINKEKSNSDTFEVAKNKLLKHLKKSYHTNFKFMKVVDLTIEDAGPEPD